MMNPDRDLVLSPKGIAVVAVLAVCLGIGTLVTPRDAAGRPVLLSPAVKAVEDYRTAARRWSSKLTELDLQIIGLLATPSGDLLSLSQSGQQTFDQVLELYSEIDRTQAPPAAASVRQQMLDCTGAYLEVARLALRWVAGPTAENRQAVTEGLAQAREFHQSIKESPWLIVTTSP